MGVTGVVGLRENLGALTALRACKRVVLLKTII